MNKRKSVLSEVQHLRVVRKQKKIIKFSSVEVIKELRKHSFDGIMGE